MNKIEIIQKDMISAMKEKNIERKEVLSSILAAAKNMAIAEKVKENISDEVVNKAITKEKKIIQEQIETCPVDRVAALDKFKTKLAIVNEYAPKFIEDIEVVKDLICDILQEEKIQLEKKNKGTIMRTIMPLLKDKIEGKTINIALGDLLV